MDLSIVILAAGQGTRMHSRLPKVLQPLAGRPLLHHVIAIARDLAASDICVVYGHGGEHVRAAFADEDVRWALQAEQRGTGHAVAQAMPETPSANLVLILCGDVPLVRAESLHRLVEAASAGNPAVLTVDMADPSGYGRIVRDETGHVLRIVEQKDADPVTQAIREINSGVICCHASDLAGWLEQLSPDNAQGEYYLTDIIEIANSAGRQVNAVKADDPAEVLGINDRRQLAEAERIYQRRATDALMRAGVTLADPSRVDVRGTLRCGRDVFIDINTVFEGDVELGDDVHIGPGAVISASAIGSGTNVHAHSVVESATVGVDCNIGPFARIRPGADLRDGARAGNFVEIKKSVIGKGSKVNHLTYIGDADVGDNVNVGAGTITCNYDGVNKHRTVIGDGAFIGSGVQLVAPVEVGAGATIGAGSTLTRDAPADKLTLNRAPQRTIDGWQRPSKK